MRDGLLLLIEACAANEGKILISYIAFRYIMFARYACVVLNESSTGNGDVV
jgi:hypothetical protein